MARIDDWTAHAIRVGGVRIGDYCLSCMEPLDGEGVCKRCGADIRTSDHMAHHLPAGTLLAHGRYLVGRAIGQGGFGITYVGRDLTLNMRVAIKEYYPTLYVGRASEESDSVIALNPKFRERLETGRRRFLEEARVLAKFHGSSGIVDVRDFFEQNGTAYIVMDYLEGETLKDYLQHETIDADRMFELVLPILDTLELIHSHQVIHRDISPDNIMMRTDGQLCLMDFGAARELDGTDNRTMSMVLKAGYAPEEQYRAKGELGPWTDIYALSATMYRAITGVAPDESLQRAIADEMAWPREMGVRITEAQEAVLKKGMAPKPDDRYQSIAQMKADLVAKGLVAGGVVGEGAGELPAQGEPAVPEELCVQEEPAAMEEPPAQEELPASEESALSSDSEQGLAQGVVASPEDSPGQGKRRKRIAAVLAAVTACVALALSALYLFAPAFTVSFDSAGGSAVGAVTLNRVEAAAEPQAPSRDDYEFQGWYLDEALHDRAAFPLKPESDTTLYAAWSKSRADYRVDYLDAADGSKVADSKKAEGVEVGSKVAEKAPAIDGYVVDGDAQAKLTVSADDAENVVAFRYRKLVGYEVRYLESGTDSEVLPPKTVDDAAEGAEVTEQAPEVDGYTLESEEEESLTVGRDAEDNVITFYYAPVPVQATASGPSDVGSAWNDSAPYYPSDSGSDSGADSSSGDSSDGGSESQPEASSGGESDSSSGGADDIEWAN